MASSLSAIKMTNPIRGLVSKRRIRYTQDGFDLDLTYINDRIIAMGYPAEHMESIYRNKIEDVQKMLEKNHAGCYKIYNLCSERSYNHKRFPYYSVYPFKDHNPPDIELITSFCRDVDEHLRADSKNVVAVHCKAGKGRTGTMICCYLLYSGQFNTAAEALHYYAQRRTSDSKGVTIPSQRRYVEYYATLLRSNETYQPVTLYICEIRIAPVLNFKEGTISVTGKSPMLLPEFKRAADEQQQHVVAKLDYCMPLAGDVKVELVKSSVLRKEKRCHFWFNTYFVEKSARKDAEGNLLLELSKSEIDDAHKDKHHKEYPNNFMVALVLRRVPNGRFSDSVSMKTPSSIVTCAMENNRQSHLYTQNQHRQMLLQQHHSPLQQQLLQQQQHPPHRQIGSDPYRPTIMKHHNSSPGGFLQHDQQQQQQHQQHHHQLQQQQQQNSLPPQQNNHHNNHHPQQQQQNLTDKQQYFKAAHENSQQQQQHYVDDSHHHHCLEYSETSSSESSTEEEGWDSGSAVSSTIRHHHITTPTSNNNNNNTSTRNGGSGNRVAVLSASNGNGSNRTTNHASSSTPPPPPPHQRHRNRRLTYDDDQPGAGATTSHGATSSPSGSRSSVTSASEGPVKSPSTASAKSPIKKSASAVETAVTTAANKLRRMSTNAIFSFSAHNSSNTNCKSNHNKPSTSSAVSGSSNYKCDIFNLLSRSPSTQQASSILPRDKGSNPSSPVTSPTKLVARSISNDPTASASGAPTDHLRRDSLPIIGSLLSSFSSSSVSSSNSSSLSTSTFGTGSTHQGLPLLSSTLGQPKTSKLQALFSVSSCYNGSYGRSVNGGHRNNGRRVIRTSSYGAYGDADDDDEGGGGGDDVDDGDDNHDDVVAAAAVASVALGSIGTRRSVVGRKITGSTTSNSDSGRSSTEIGPEVDKDKVLSQHNGQSAAVNSPPESLVRYRLLSEPEIVNLLASNGAAAVGEGGRGSPSSSPPSAALSSSPSEQQPDHHPPTNGSTGSSSPIAASAAVVTSNAANHPSSSAANSLVQLV